MNHEEVSPVEEKRWMCWRQLCSQDFKEREQLQAMSNTLVMRRYTAGKWRKMPRQIMKKITNKEYCSVNSNEMGIKYVPFSLTLSL